MAVREAVLLAGFVLGAAVGGARADSGVSSYRPISAASPTWRPLMPNEVCPQAHVEVFEDTNAGRRWSRPQVDGRDVPCGLAKHVAGVWRPLDESEHCQAGYVEILLPSGAQRVTYLEHEVRCAVVRAP